MLGHLVAPLSELVLDLYYLMMLSVLEVKKSLWIALVVAFSLMTVIVVKILDLGASQSVSAQN